VKKDGGRFDSMAGATVTPRAVIKAIRRAALFVEAHREKIMASR
jgi:electron transport complex protein RnfG